MSALEGRSAKDVIACGIALSVGTASVARLVRRACRARDKIGQLRSLLKRLSDAVRSWSSAEAGAEDEVGRIARQEMARIKADAMQAGCQACSVLLFPLTMGMAWQIARNGPGYQRMLSMPQTFIYLAFHSLVIAAANVPALARASTLDATYGLFFALIAAFTSPWCVEPSFQGLCSTVMVNIPLALLTMSYRKLSIVAAMNALVVVSICATFVVHFHTQRGGMAVVPAVNCFCLSTLVSVAHQFEISELRFLRQGIESEAVKESLSAATAILRSCCDVVVELDQQGTIMSEALDLRGFLLRPACILQGTPLARLISHEADRRLFQDKMLAERRAAGDLAEAIHVRMKDGSGNTLRVELLWFRFRNLRGEPRYMLGLREFSDAQAQGDHHQRLGQRQSAELGERQRSGELQPGGHSDDGVEESGEPSLQSGLSQSSLDSRYDPPAILAVDSLCNGLHVRECTAGFRYRIGRLALGFCFADLVHRKQDFVQWVHDAVNAAMHQEEARPCSVVLNMRQGQVQAQCRLLLRGEGQSTSFSNNIADQEEAADIDMENVKLLFFEIKECRKVRLFKGTPSAHMTL